MLISFEHHIPGNVLHALAPHEVERYKIEKSNFTKERRYEVYGILFCGNTILYLICYNEKARLFSLYNSLFFKMIDPSTSRYWKVYIGITNKHMIYENVSFRNFNYIGIDRFANEPDFFHDYHTGGAEEGRYLDQMIGFITAESRGEMPPAGSVDE